VDGVVHWDVAADGGENDDASVDAVAENDGDGDLAAADVKSAVVGGDEQKLRVVATFQPRIFYDFRLRRQSFVARFQRRSIQPPFVARFRRRSFPWRRVAQPLRRPSLVRASVDVGPQSSAQPDQTKKKKSQEIFFRLFHSNSYQLQ
jgi:hypothetical protein